MKNVILGAFAVLMTAGTVLYANTTDKKITVGQNEATCKCCECPPNCETGTNCCICSSDCK